MDKNKFSIGQEIYSLADQIFPICRSITGEGVRKTIAIINEYIGDIGYCLDTHEVPTGTKVFDWEVPKEWNIFEAYIEDESGKRIVDFNNNNLHVVGYSVPVNKWVSLDELKKHIYTMENQPDWIPYVTSYYKETYGFCMSKNMLDHLPKGNYHMVINSELKKGSMTYADLIIQGESPENVFLTTYICHPSMANNECSGPALMARLIKYICGKKRRYTYRIVFAPETIGAITYLAQNMHELKEKVIAAFNLTCVGDDREYSMLCSRYGNTLADKILENVLKEKEHYKKYSFLDRGSDERQYCAPGIDLPMAVFSRSKYLEYPEYHTSADNMSIVSPEGFYGSYEVMVNVIEAIENNRIYKTKSIGEPQLGKRGLFPEISKKGVYDAVKMMTNTIAYADGTNDVIDLSNITHIPVREILPILETLRENDLLEIVNIEN